MQQNIFVFPPNLKNILFIVVGLSLICSSCSAQKETRFTGNETATYDELIAAYHKLDKVHADAKLIEMGTTDAGKPLHVFLINKSGQFEPSLFAPNKCVILINNAIHPGEPCGVDASLKLAETLLTRDLKYGEMLQSVVVAIIPAYNIGGMLNRSCCSRANQNGPLAYGFRGNAKNLDLNRDFIKTDSENAKSFTRLYQKLNPHILVDTHTSNGADYQYVMTLITTQPDKATAPQGEYLRQEIEPALYKAMEKDDYPMIPYVNSVKRTPDEGIKDYLETPRYSTGYAALFNCLGFVSETHMLKPFEDRVESTYQLLKNTIQYAAKHNRKITALKNESDSLVKDMKAFPVKWELDTLSFRNIPFKGYEAGYKPSAISGKDRLFYDQSKPFEKEIKYFNTYKPTVIIQKPKYYVVPQAWTEVISRLRMNGVKMKRLANDVTIPVETYQIVDRKTSGAPYEGHYLHSEVKVDKSFVKKQYKSGDFVIEVNQTSNRYIVETLEPEAHDSFFAWGFFDSILQQKEWFSDYVFEDHAAAMLENDPALKTEFETKKKEDFEFAQNGWAQLYWLYKKSEFYEASSNLYPVGRVMDQSVVLSLY